MKEATPEALAEAEQICARLTAELASLGAAEGRLEAQRRLHRELEGRATALERANAALEDFAYAASHDLQAPLRAITHFATWIEEDLPADASETVRMYVARLRDRVERMTCLQEKLLAYARITGQRSELSEVDLLAMVRDVWSLVIPPDGFALVVEAEPAEVIVAEEGLRTVMRNLISNAIHHHDQGRGTVWVRIEREEGRVILEVIDDGPGVPAEEAERIFRASHMLRATGPGTGMGLAIARRYAEHVGGFVHLIPTPGRGAHFRVEWPLGNVPEPRSP